MDMRVTFQEESFNEKCFNKIFQGLSFKWIGLELPMIKEIAEVERIENYKLPLLMFLLEDDTLLHMEIMNDEIKPDLQSMFTYVRIPDYSDSISGSIRTIKPDTSGHLVMYFDFT